MGRKKLLLDQRMVDAIHMRAEGESYTKIGEKLGVKAQTVRYWFDNKPEVLDEYKAVMKSKIQAAYGKAMGGYVRDLDDKNPWIRQNAQRVFVDGFGKMVMGEEKQEIVVRISGGMPNIGMPERTGDEE